MFTLQQMDYKQQLTAVSLANKAVKDSTTNVGGIRHMHMTDLTPGHGMQTPKGHADSLSNQESLRHWLGHAGKLWDLLWDCQSKPYTQFAIAGTVVCASLTQRPRQNLRL